MIISIFFTIFKLFKSIYYTSKIIKYKVGKLRFKTQKKNIYFIKICNANDMVDKPNFILNNHLIISRYL